MPDMANRVERTFRLSAETLEQLQLISEWLAKQPGYKQTRTGPKGKGGTAGLATALEDAALARCLQLGLIPPHATDASTPDGTSPT